MRKLGRSKYILINSLRLHYIESGDKNARPMILLHGTGDNAHTWDHFVSNMSKYFRTLALDQRGHGDSEWAKSPAYGCEDYVSDLADFIEALQLEGVVLVGHSMGALHADSIASMKSQKVSALIHVDIEPCPPTWNKEYLRNLYHTLPEYYESTEDLMRQIEKTSPFAEKGLLFRLASFSLYEGMDGKLRTKFDKEVLHYFDHYNVNRHLPNINCPTLIIRGKESQVMRREKAEQMNRMIFGSRFEEIPLATHPVHADNPDGFQRAIFRFLKNAGLVFNTR